MAVSLSSLRVDATLDASGYTRGAAQKNSMDAAMIASDRSFNISQQQVALAMIATGQQLGRYADMMDVNQKALAQLNAANEENRRSWGMSGLEIASVTNHLKQAAVAAYVLSPAFQQMTNRVIVSGLKDVGASLYAIAPSATAVAASIAGRLSPALSLVFRAAGPILLVKDAFDLMAYSTELAKQRIVEYSAIADKANASGFSTEYFQRITKAAEQGRGSIDDITESLKKFNDATTAKLGGSDLEKRLAASTGVGNFAKNPGVAALGVANDQEQRLRAIVGLIDTAMAKGERLAALDIAGTAFGPKVQAALTADSAYLDQMLSRADAISKAELVSDADVGRALDLKIRMDEAQKILAEKWKPVQEDLAKLGMQYHASWVDITQDMAAAVGYATQLYTALGNVPDWFAKKIGGASIWTDITNATTTPESRAAAETSHGISRDPADIAAIGQNAQLAAAMQNRNNITQAMRQATETYTRVLGDNSHAIDTNAKSQSAARDQFDRASDAVEKHIARLQADTAAVGLGEGALEQFRARAQLVTAAAQAGIPVIGAVADKIDRLAKSAGDAGLALARAKLGDNIKFDIDTAFLTDAERQIAAMNRQLHGDDWRQYADDALSNQKRLAQGLNDISNLFQDVNRGMFTDFTQQLRNGANAFDAFRTAGLNALGKIADKLAGMAADNLWKSAFGGTSGGSLLSIFGLGGGDVSGGSSANPLPGLTAADYGAGFASGGYTGYGGKFDPAGIVHRGEYVFDADATRRIGVHALDGLRGYASGGYVTPAKGGGGQVVIDMQDHRVVNIGAGASAETVAQLQAAFVEDRRQRYSDTVKIVADAKSRGTLR